SSDAGDPPAAPSGPLSAVQVAELVAGTYDSLWGRTRLAVLGGRLFSVDEASLDPAAAALELSVDGVRSDPIEPELETVELATWGDSGYGTWAEPILARLVRADGDADRGRAGPLRCAGRAVNRQGQT